MRVWIEPDQWLHPKNREGMECLFRAGLLHRAISRNDADVVFAPSHPLPSNVIAANPHVWFIFGPHFSNYPDHRILSLPSLPNVCFTVPSKWTQVLWGQPPLGVSHIPVRLLPFAVDVGRFAPSGTKDPGTYFIYLKHRRPADAHRAIQMLQHHGFGNPIVFDYNAGYDETTFLQTLQRASFGVWVGSTESQGFALEEALACDTPLYVWNVTRLGDNHPPDPHAHQVTTEATTVPFWSPACGSVESGDTFESSFSDFIEKVRHCAFSPRGFIEKNLSPRAIWENYWLTMFGTKPSPNPLCPAPDADAL